MNSPKETVPDGARLAEATRNHLVGWRIPDGIPISPDTAIVPIRPDPDMVRTSCRALHTLLVRSCPDTVILLGMRPDRGSRAALVASGRVTTPLGTVGIDVGRASKIARALSGQIEVFTGDHLGTLSPGTGIETLPVLLQVLAPGCRVVPLLLGEGDEPSPREIGLTLAELFVEETVVLAGGTELAEELQGTADVEPPRERLRKRDAELIRTLLDLDLEEATRIANLGGASAPAVLVAALAHARACGAKRGHLIEYVRSGEESTSRAWTGRAGIVF
jgi:AmmeMemoRadiSam system protein B